VSGAQRFRREDRLLRAEDFERVFARKCSVRGEYLILHGCENDVERPRLGRVVGKRWGDAVTRNRYRRWIREAFRQTTLPAGIDYVVMPAKAEGLSLAVIRKEFEVLADRLARKLNL
jgi:ribonuclease P protein component